MQSEAAGKGEADIRLHATKGQKVSLLADPVQEFLKTKESYTPKMGRVRGGLPKKALRQKITPPCQQLLSLNLVQVRKKWERKTRRMTGPEQG